MGPQVVVKYTGTALPLKTSTNVLFSTVVAFPRAYALAGCGLARLLLDLAIDVNATLNWYKSDDRGTTWITLGTQAVTGSSSATTIVDFLVEEYRDFKLECVINNTTDTAVFSPNMTLTPQRVQA